MALSGARKNSQSRDPGGRRLESTKICLLRRGGMIFPPTVGPRWRLEVSKKRRRSPRAEYNTRRGRGHETVDEEIIADALTRPEIEAMTASAKNLRRRSQAPTLELRLFEFSSRGLPNRRNTSCPHDCPAYCCPSLGLGNTAGAETLAGDVWGALKSKKYVGGP